MKVVIVSNSDSVGGAARAAFRLMSAMIKQGTHCNMVVKRKLSGSPHVIENRSSWKKAKGLVLQKLSSLIASSQKSSSSVLHSLNIFGSDVFQSVNNENPTVINIHWVNFETLSIRQIAKFKQPVVMTLHDMWAFCGAEHLSPDSPNSAFRLGYDLGEHGYVSGLRINKYIWNLKKNHWTQPFHLVVPSKWMADCVKTSELFKGWPVSVVPNALDTNTFKPLEKGFCRDAFNLPLDKKLIGFGVFGNIDDPNKGLDLLKKALSSLQNKHDYHCVVLGQESNLNSEELPIPSTYVGHISDDTALSLIYNALDVMVVPSRQESLSQTGTEASSCGTPVVAFAYSGLLDVVEHMKTGFLAEPYDTLKLANGIEWCVENNLDCNLSINARKRAKSLWSYDAVAGKYSHIFERVATKL
ncbi:glycosyltransferase [Vibrio salilacus]|uniref:glycosyltransferase n=1 Tax=Vibrio salilacus TaxID=1323749 RepID=UPI000C2B1DEC|nr:glycosyltransferase [Vibrio salilacus]